VWVAVFLFKTKYHSTTPKTVLWCCDLCSSHFSNSLIPNTKWHHINDNVWELQGDLLVPWILNQVVPLWLPSWGEIYKSLPSREGRDTPRKNGWGCAGHFPKPSPLLWPKSVIVPTLFMTWPKLRNPIYDLTRNQKPVPDSSLDMGKKSRFHHYWKEN